jgi:hypothetical protein
MFNKSCFVLLAAVLSLGGCASQAEPEPTAAHDDALLGAITSPIGVENHHMLGAWQPVQPARFRGPAKTLHFTDDSGTLDYRWGDDACTSQCRSDGTFYVTENPIVWFFAGTYVDFRAKGTGQEGSLFLWKRLDGEIWLVDLSSWDWPTGRYTNTWRRTPALTLADIDQ